VLALELVSDRGVHDWELSFEGRRICVEGDTPDIHAVLNKAMSHIQSFIIEPLLGAQKD